MGEELVELDHEHGQLERSTMLFLGKLTNFLWPCSIVMLDYQRVYLGYEKIRLWLIWYDNVTTHESMSIWNILARYNLDLAMGRLCLIPIFIDYSGSYSEYLSKHIMGYIMAMAISKQDCPTDMIILSTEYIIAMGRFWNSGSLTLYQRILSIWWDILFWYSGSVIF